jgi:hypothetical protein
MFFSSAVPKASQNGCEAMLCARFDYATGLGNEKSPQKRRHSRYNFGYGILLYVRKMDF